MRPDKFIWNDKDVKILKVPKVNLKSRSMLPQFSEAELTVLAERVGLTLEQLKLLHDLAHATYQQLGYDLQGPHKREDLVEVILDADYIEMNSGRRLTPELRAWLRSKASNYKLDWVYEAVGAGFPFPQYE